MAQSDREGTQPGLPAFVLLLAAVLGAALLYEPPLEGSRPPSAQKPVFYQGFQDIEARLWQDPFSALETYRKLAEPGADGRAPALQRLDAVLGEAFGHGGVTAGGPCQVDALVVLVNGGSFDEAAESRRRARYAVLSALHVSGFEPVDNHRIGIVAPVSAPAEPGPFAAGGTSMYAEASSYFEQATGSRAPPAPGSAVRGGRLLVPFEVYRPLRAQAPPVLVLWVDENALGERPLSALNWLPDYGDANQPSCMRFRVRLKVIGPDTSNGLRQLAREAVVDGAASGRFQFYTATATADDARILEDLKDPGGATLAGLMAASMRPDGGLLRLVATDRVLVRALAEELEQRHLRFKRPERAAKGAAAHVALISEWDTVYGRALPRDLACAIASQARRRSGREPPAPTVSDAGDCELPYVHRYVYMRGLDGETPGAAAKAREDNGNGKSSNGSDRSGAAGWPGRGGIGERAEGDAQLDYLRRMARQIKAKDDELRRSGQAIRAIGVLGTDVYDKLLILRALKPLFPQAVFFTTDLDGRLMQRRELEWTRNLVVASAFDLSLNDELQAGIPPFRDSYQTARYFAALLALGDFLDVGNVEDQQRRVNASWLRPRLFEIGSTGAVPLGTAEPTPQGGAIRARIGGATRDLEGIHPQLPHARPRWQTLARVVVLALTLVGLLYVSIQEFRSWANGFVVSFAGMRRTWSRGDAIAGLVLTLAVGGFFLLTRQAAQSEPFHLASGISIWPTEVLRLVAALVSIILVLWGWETLRKGQDKLTADFCLDGHAVRLPDDLRRRIAYVFDCDLTAGSAPPARHTVASVWRNYLCLGSGSARRWRVLTAGVLFAILCGTMIAIFGRPFVPARGLAALWMDRLILILSVVLFIVLLFFVVDAIRLCTRLAGRLEKPLEWPEEAVRNEVRRLGIQPQAAGEAVGSDPADPAHDLLVENWLDVRFMARLTKDVGPLIYGPFFILALMVLARSTVFDAWDLPLGLGLTFTASALYAVYCAMALRRAVEDVRTAATERLQDLLVRAQADAQDARRRQIELLLGRIRGLREGAFAPFTQQPVFRAVLLPFGGAGLMPLLDYLAVAAI